MVKGLLTCLQAYCLVQLHELRPCRQCPRMRWHGHLCTCSSHLPLLPRAAGSGEQAIQALLDCLVGVVRKDGRRGSRPYELVTSLNKRLSRLGLWTGPGGRQGGFQLLRGYSRHLVDSPPVAGEAHARLHIMTHIGTLAWHCTVQHIAICWRCGWCCWQKTQRFASWQTGDAMKAASYPHSILMPGHALPCLAVWPAPLLQARARPAWPWSGTSCPTRRLPMRCCSWRWGQAA